ncbi:DUF1624 domain-containing protein [Candidatus Woesearchaeota archaeon]|nr:DUF1624 domain-containing protein [Candidatus Woesearchaeota archaeon]
MMISQTNALPPSPSGTDLATFNQILQPVWQVYNFVKYLATALATIFLVIAGITYMTSGNDVSKRESAKYIMSYTVLGMIVVIGAPYIVQIFTS